MPGGCKKVSNTKMYTGFVVHAAGTHPGAVDEVHNNFVIEELDGLPLDALARVLVLFCSQNLLDENLLQLLVDVVDTQLLETVAIENFKTVNV